jgi:hypothetical protein
MGEKCTSGIVVDAVGLTEVAVRRVFGVRARSGDYTQSIKLRVAAICEGFQPPG